MLTLRKVKDGEDGAVFGFRLAPVDLGPTAEHDGDETERESSCVVEETAHRRQPAAKHHVGTSPSTPCVK